MAFNEPPPKPRGLLWKKNRKWAEDFYRWMSENQPQYGGPLQKTANGFVVKRGSRRAPSVPFFNPTLTRPEGEDYRLLTIGHGWFLGPSVDAAGDYQVIHRAQARFKPTIVSDPIDVLLGTGLYPSLTVPAAKASIVSLKVTTAANTATIGGTVEGSETGVDLLLSSDMITTSVDGDHTHAPGTYEISPDSVTGASGEDGEHSHTNTHQHTGIIRLAQKVYYIDAAPSFVIYDETGAGKTPDDTETIKYMDVGRFEIDANGEMLTSLDEDWYLDGHIQWFQETIIKGTETGNDNGANPSVEP